MKVIIGITALFALLIGIGIVIGEGRQAGKDAEEHKGVIESAAFNENQAQSELVIVQGNLDVCEEKNAEYVKENTELRAVIYRQYGKEGLARYGLAQKSSSQAILQSERGKWRGSSQVNAIVGAENP